jgi:hypothetical protein
MKEHSGGGPRMASGSVCKIRLRSNPFMSSGAMSPHRFGCSKNADCCCQRKRTDLFALVIFN